MYICIFLKKEWSWCNASIFYFYHILTKSIYIFFFRVSKLEVEEHPVTAPTFLTQLQGQTRLEEGQTAHFEAKIEPIHDPNLRVEFYHKGKALQQASR